MPTSGGAAMGPAPGEHLRHHHQVTPEPAKRPKSSYIRFQAEQPNECWQSDFTHYPLADRTGTEILTRLDETAPQTRHPEP